MFVSALAMDNAASWDINAAWLLVRESTRTAIPWLDSSTAEEDETNETFISIEKALWRLLESDEEEAVNVPPIRRKFVNVKFPRPCLRWCRLTKKLYSSCTMVALGGCALAEAPEKQRECAAARYATSPGRLLTFSIGRSPSLGDLFSHILRGNETATTKVSGALPVRPLMPRSICI